MGARPRRGFVHARVDLLPQVVDLILLPPRAPQVTQESSLVRQDLALEPRVWSVRHPRDDTPATRPETGARAAGRSKFGDEPPRIGGLARWIVPVELRPIA
jgi:hypothetical protein